MKREVKQALVSLLLDNEPEIKCDSEKSQKISGDIRIVILQRGWIYVGEYFQQDNECWLEKAHCIRNWGTTKGLGELATNGPTSSTKLDACPTVEFHRLTVICTIKCDTTVWKKILS